jgi:ribosome-binding factor A
MPKEYSRTTRVAEQLQRELSELIRGSIKDPRLGPVTVTEVTVSRDLGHAKVFVSFLGRQEGREERLGILNHASSFLQRELGRRLKMRAIPIPHFVYDELLDKSAQLDRLIHDAVAEDQRYQADAEPSHLDDED